MYYLCILCLLIASTAHCAETTLSYAVVDTGQGACFDDQGRIEPPHPGEPFFGQDAQVQRAAPRYVPSEDRKTVYDRVTGLTWQRSPDTDGDAVLTSRDKLTWRQARTLPSRLNAARYGGYDDWRLPTIKQLYSLILFSGRDPDPRATTGQRPFIDTRHFAFAYGDPSQGERLIDAQYASSTRYVGESGQGGKLFGVNFADGRIKGYDLLMPGRSVAKTFFVQLVRGNPEYGINDFQDNEDGTILDRATGLTWSKDDSGRLMNWKSALAWVQEQNAQRYRGYDDWRLPDAKELQSIVDYGRAPDATRSPAIDPLFRCTPLRNELGQQDYPYYWTSTTHIAQAPANNSGRIANGRNAVYIAFGRAAGWMQGPDGRRYVDIHGAGSQRSDPKAGDPENFRQGRGPQGDIVRIHNAVRLVRGGR